MGCFCLQGTERAICGPGRPCLALRGRGSLCHNGVHHVSVEWDCCGMRKFGRISKKEPPLIAVPTNRFWVNKTGMQDGGESW